MTYFEELIQQQQNEYYSYWEHLKTNETIKGILFLQKTRKEENKKVKYAILTIKATEETTSKEIIYNKEQVFRIQIPETSILKRKMLPEIIKRNLQKENSIYIEITKTSRKDAKIKIEKLEEHHEKTTKYNNY